MVFLYNTSLPISSHISFKQGNFKIGRLLAIVRHDVIKGLWITPSRRGRRMCQGTFALIHKRSQKVRAITFFQFFCTTGHCWAILDLSVSISRPRALRKRETWRDKHSGNFQTTTRTGYHENNGSTWATKANNTKPQLCMPLQTPIAILNSEKARWAELDSWRLGPLNLEFTSIESRTGFYVECCYPIGPDKPHTFQLPFIKNSEGVLNYVRYLYSNSLET